jgi:hypothetical protein
MVVDIGQKYKLTGISMRPRGKGKFVPLLA